MVTFAEFPHALVTFAELPDALQALRFAAHEKASERRPSVHGTLSFLPPPHGVRIRFANHKPHLTTLQATQLALALISDTSKSCLEVSTFEDVGFALSVLEALKQAPSIKNVSFSSEVRPYQVDNVAIELIEMFLQTASLISFRSQYFCHSKIALALPRGIKHNSLLQFLEIVIHDRDGTAFLEHCIEILEAIKESSLRHAKISIAMSDQVTRETECQLIHQAIPQFVVMVDEMLEHKSQLRSFACNHLSESTHQHLIETCKHTVACHEISFANAVLRSRLRRLELFGIEDLPQVKMALLSSRRNMIISLSGNGDQMRGTDLSGEEVFVIQPSSRTFIVDTGCIASQIAEMLQVDLTTLSFFDEHRRVRKEASVANIDRITVRIVEDAEDAAWLEEVESVRHDTEDYE